ncbi:ABC transporter substrate-binding protein [Glycomyces tenuis]|uniref:ABC transporter substrate-binding protein n=1 Tax=Glycomyces tenuis TaxID=58116 RepID=UPI00041919EA|nr:extracellular solute-binding protein [Glycomyces tenuis]
MTWNLSRRSALAATGAAAVALTGCGQENPAADVDLESMSWNEILKQAEKDGKVTLYLAMANYEDRVKLGFEKAHPDIDLTIVREPSGDLITRIQTEAGTNTDGADVAMLSDYRFFEDQSDLVAKAYGSSAKLYGDADPVGGDNYFTTAAVPFTIATNPEVIADAGAQPVERWEDILQPELEGLIGVTRPDITPIEVQFLFALQQELGAQFIEDLAGLSPRLGDSSGTLAQSVAAGELAVSLGGTTPTTATLIDEGAPVEAPVGTDPEVLIGYATGAISSSHRPAAAQVLLEWMISPEGQASQHEWGMSASVLPEVDNKLDVDTSVIYTGELTEEEQAFLDETWTPLFG